MADATPDNQRLRPHPEGRFAAPKIEIDLQAAIARLRAEPRAGERGHRQETLYRHGGATIALFAFAASRTWRSTTPTPPSACTCCGGC